MNKLPRYDFLNAVTNAAAQAYLLMEKEVPEDIVLWETMEMHRLNPVKFALAKGGLIKMMQLREVMHKKVEGLEAVDQQR